jgi:hypothetical protein
MSSRQANWNTMLYDLTTHEELALPDIPHAVATYPASAATAMLTQNKANNWTAPILFCGGADIESQEWVTHGDDTAWFRAHELSKKCSSITPVDETSTWQDDDDMLEVRNMVRRHDPSSRGKFNVAQGNLIALPDGRYLLVNGISSGVAGYDKNGWPCASSLDARASLTLG